MINKTRILITKNLGTPEEEEVNIVTDGYIVLYLEGDKIKSSGDIELASLAQTLSPYFMRLAVEKLTKKE